MAEVRFYQLSGDPVERVVPLLATKILDTGALLLVVSADSAQRAALSQALWEREDAFLANGEADQSHAQRQPILLSSGCEAENGANALLIADGIWREQAATFESVILLFGSEQTEEARRLWTLLGPQGHVLRIFKQRDDGHWREGR